MAWLLRQGEVLASVDVGRCRGAALRSAAGSETADGVAVIVRGARAVHTFGAGHGVDVAHLDDDLVVVALSRIGRHGVGLRRRRARSLLVARAGSFDRWGLACGDQLEIKE